MRGYLSFLLVFASVFLILNLMQASAQPSKISFPNAIAAERAYQVQMNVKEAVIEGIREGGKSGFEAYSLTHSKPACSDPDPATRAALCFEPTQAKFFSEYGSFHSLSAIDTAQFDKDMEIGISCSPFVSKNDAYRMANGMACANCEKWDSQVKNLTEVWDMITAQSGKISCFSAVYAQIEPGPGMQNDNLTKLITMEPIVITVRYPAFNITAVSYIPAGYEVAP